MKTALVFFGGYFVGALTMLVVLILCKMAADGDAAFEDAYEAHVRECESCQEKEKGNDEP